jgi:wyosine [tRNA(Phe)-imidazoG37] synthetase (radical SAM superfamily)
LSKRIELRQVKPKEQEIIYGPVKSRRLKHSLGINVNPRKGKTCSFDCVYCQYGRTVNLITSPHSLEDWLQEAIILKETENCLRKLNKEDKPLNSITFSGYGESTLYPNLLNLIKEVKNLRGEYYPDAQVNMLTNASSLTEPRVYQSLMELDSIIAKLDAGSEQAFKAINRPAPGLPSLNTIVEELSRLQDESDKIILQTLIFKNALNDYLDNSSLKEIDLIAEKAKIIDPNEIQVYTVARRPTEPHVTPVDEETLREITLRINHSIGRNCAKSYT